MVQQLIKFKSKLITPENELIIEEWHGKTRRKELASMIGVNENTLKFYLRKNGYPLKREGRYIVPFEEQKVTIVISGIPRKNYLKAFKAAEEAVKEFKK